MTCASVYLAAAALALGASAAAHVRDLGVLREDRRHPLDDGFEVQRQVQYWAGHVG